MRALGYIKSTPSITDIILNSSNMSVVLPSQYRLPIEGEVLDQGNTNSCVACSAYELINYHCKIEHVPCNIKYMDIYKEKGTSKGMSPRDAFEYMKSHKFIRTYAKINDIDTLKKSLIANGPAIMALPVYDSSRNDFWNGSKLEGGHAVAIVGYDKDSFIIKNSWGSIYGKYGYYEFPFSDWRKVMELWTILN